MSKIKMIKSNAVVSIKMGTPFIEQLQKTMVFLLDQLTEAQSKELLDGLKNGKTTFSDPLIENAMAIVVLVRTIEKEVFDNKLYVEEEFNPEDNLRPDQAQ